jgi:uncharacterized membrane protein YGL010W
MNTIIKKEYVEFEKYHKNIYNIYFHFFIVSTYSFEYLQFSQTI